MKTLADEPRAGEAYRLRRASTRSRRDIFIHACDILERERERARTFARGERSESGKGESVAVREERKWLGSRLVDDRAKRARFYIRYAHTYASLCTVLRACVYTRYTFTYTRAHAERRAHARLSATERLRRCQRVGEAGRPATLKRRSHIRMDHWRQHRTVSDHGLRLFHCGLPDASARALSARR